MVIILHCDSCHSLHHNHSHESCSHRLKSFHDDDLKSLQIDDRKLTKPQMTQSSSCKSENINVQAAFLHVIGDLIQSIGVIITAVVIKFYVCKLENLWNFDNLTIFFAASSENCWSIDHAFFLHHCDLHDRKNLQKVSGNLTWGSARSYFLWWSVVWSQESRRSLVRKYIKNSFEKCKKLTWNFLYLQHRQRP